ncbi:MAG: hypothetical protein QXD48_02950 [Candidatus Aenigmatarchaeota archaeon]
MLCCIHVEILQIRCKCDGGTILSTTFIDSILKKKPDLLCFLDLSIDQEWREFETLKKKLKATLS